ncbi:MAG TPA: AraC family transcriptional regulator, partial [Chloroflexota bacterium]|nr:AraC family transcriptional regulator [Chloroflexota bacterium]
WTASVTGKALPTEERCRNIQSLKKRLAASGPEFQRIVKETRERGNWDAGFVDALCDPPESFTYGGMLAHVVTFNVYRRTLALLAFRELGVDDLGIGDPVEWERSLS